MEAVWIFLTLEALTFEVLEPLTARAFSFAAGAAFEPVVCSSLLRLDRIERSVAQAKASLVPLPLVFRRFGFGLACNLTYLALALLR